MSQLSDLTGGGINNAIPGFPLSRRTNAVIAEVEDHLQRWFVESAIRNTERLHDSLRKELLGQAQVDAKYFMVYDTPHFRQQLRSGDGRWISILASARAANPKLNAQALGEKINAMPDDELNAIVDWIWFREKKATAPLESGTGETHATTKTQ